MTTRTVDAAPAALPLLVKAALPAIPLVGRLPGIRHTGHDAPDLVLRHAGIRPDADRLARYRDVCGFSPSRTVPATYPHVPAFALHLALMTDTAFPVAPMGLVHLRHSTTQLRPLGAEEVIDLDVRAADLRAHPQGRLIDILTDATVDGETVWSETMTLLSRGRGRADDDPTRTLADLEAPGGTVEWRVPGDLGRRYGAVSGDRNPIHVHPLTAKAFGFPRAIAHGMWTVARSLAELQADLPEAFRIDVEFRKPILLPGTVTFGATTTAGTTDIGVTGTDRPATHLVGRITPS